MFPYFIEKMEREREREREENRGEGKMMGEGVGRKNIFFHSDMGRNVKQHVLNTRIGVGGEIAPVPSRIIL